MIRCLPQMRPSSVGSTGQQPDSSLLARYSLEVLEGVLRPHHLQLLLVPTVQTVEDVHKQVREDLRETTRLKETR